MSWLTWFKLLCAGWRRNRDVWDRLHLPDGFRVFPEAKRILSEYGDLKFGDSNEWMRFDPSVGNKIREQVGWGETRIGRTLYPLGVSVHQDETYVLVDENGFLYTLILDDAPGPKVTADLEPEGSSFERALSWLIPGSSTKGEEKRRDLQTIGIFGKSWRLEPREESNS